MSCLLNQSLNVFRCSLNATSFKMKQMYKNIWCVVRYFDHTRREVGASFIAMFYYVPVLNVKHAIFLVSFFHRFSKLEEKIRCSFIRPRSLCTAFVIMSIRFELTLNQTCGSWVLGFLVLASTKCSKHGTNCIKKSCLA